MRVTSLLWPLAIVTAAFFAGLGACNTGTGDCPAKETITAGGACSDDNLQCAYDLASPSPACDGTSTTIPSSCVCTKGTWVCPDPVSCGDGAASTDTDGATDDGSGDEGDAAPSDDGPAPDAGDSGADGTTS